MLANECVHVRECVRAEIQNEIPTTFFAETKICYAIMFQELEHVKTCVYLEIIMQWIIAQKSIRKQSAIDSIIHTWNISREFISKFTSAFAYFRHSAEWHLQADLMAFVHCIHTCFYYYFIFHFCHFDCSFAHNAPFLYPLSSLHFMSAIKYRLANICLFFTHKFVLKLLHIWIEDKQIYRKL